MAALNSNDVAYLQALVEREQEGRLDPTVQVCDECGEEPYDQSSSDGHVLLRLSNGKTVVAIGCEGYHQYETTGQARALSY